MSGLIDEYVEQKTIESRLKERLGVGGYSYLPTEIYAHVQWGDDGTQFFWCDKGAELISSLIDGMNYYSIHYDKRFASEDAVSFVATNDYGERKIFVFRSSLEVPDAMEAVEAVEDLDDWSAPSADWVRKTFRKQVNKEVSYLNRDMNHDDF